MGFNTVVMLLNDRAHVWPDEIRWAMNCWEPRPTHPQERGLFGYGKVVSCAHADHCQITSVSRNSGKLLHLEPVERVELEAMADILQANGWGVKAPGAKKNRSVL